MSDTTSEIPVTAGDEHLLEGSKARQSLLDLAGSADRRRALLVDPSLAALSEPEAEFSDQEVRELKRSVLQAQRLREVELSSAEPVRMRFSGLAVALTLCLLLLLPASLKRPPETVATTSTAAPQPVPVSMTHASVEALGLPGARVYELADEGFSLVLVVDESFEL